VTKDKEKIGAVMVAGAGIAGIQASLDLANSGMKVYLVEKGISIGGLWLNSTRPFPPMTALPVFYPQSWWKSAVIRT